MRKTFLPKSSEERGMKPFDYSRPATVPEAVAAAAEPSAAFFAGGTTLLDLMKVGVMRPRVWSTSRACLADRLDRLADGGIRIGALARKTDSHMTGFRRAFPASPKRCWPVPLLKFGTWRPSAAT